jgi:hypothetical protein
MSNVIDTIITVIVGTISGIAGGIARTVSGLDDFFYVKFYGLSFIVLGARQTGKTTLIEWLRRNMTNIGDFAPEPTAAGGDMVDDFASRVDGDKYLKLKPNRDVGGEHSMWETDWLELFREAQPRGIIFMIDHTDPYMHKDALNFVMQMIDDEPEARRNLKAFFIMVNKSDIWNSETDFDDILQTYKNEQKRLKALAERVGFKWSISNGSLMTGEGVTEMMRKFFNVIRPKPKPQYEI